MISFRIDRRSGVAAYLQLVHQVRQAIRLGQLAPGDQLPTAKEVVELTGMNPNTVLKAYRELEHAGLAEGRRGVGTFIRANSQRDPIDPMIRAELDAWMQRARTAGLDAEDIDAVFAAVRQHHYPTGAAATHDR